MLIEKSQLVQIAIHHYTHHRSWEISLNDF